MSQIIEILTYVKVLVFRDKIKQKPYNIQVITY